MYFEKALRRYDNKTIIIVILAIICIFTTISISHADYAAWQAGTEEASGITKLVMKWIDDIFNVDSLSNIENMVNIHFDFESDAVNIGGINITGISNAVKGVNELMILAATAIVVICFMIDLEKTYVSHLEWNGQTLAKKFVVLGIALVLIGKSLWISEQLANFGSGMTAAVINKISSSPSSTATLETIKELVYNDCQKEVTGNWFEKVSISFSNVGTQLSYMMQLLAPKGCTIAASLVISFICWGRSIQILILAALSPIPFSDLVGERNKAGEKFVRNFLALALQGVVIVIAMYFCTSIIAGIMLNMVSLSDFSSMMDYTYQVVVICLVEMGLIVKSNNITREVVGLT